MVRGKASSNWVLGIGYLLMASIILFNYIRQKPETRSHPVKSEEADKDNPDLESLKKQLLEERRVNREMSEMLAKVQSVIRAGGSTIPESARASLPAIEMTADEILNGIFRHGFPRLEILAQTPQEGPPRSADGRNPFLPYYERTKYRNPGFFQAPKTPKKNLDSRIPLFLQNTWNKPVVYESSESPNSLMGELNH